MTLRIASLLPSATEIVVALGLGDSLVGVSHECDYPQAVTRLPHLTKSTLPPDLSAAEIDTAVSAALRDGHSIYELDLALLERLDADIVITQELCDVCAVQFPTVQRLINSLPRPPQLLSLKPGCLTDVIADVAIVAEALGVAERGQTLVQQLKQRLERLQNRPKLLAKPGVVALEWLDPPFLGGHWVPEQITLAGGIDLLGKPHQPSRRATWQEVATADPDVILLMPCGYNQKQTAAMLQHLSHKEWLSLRAVQNGHVYPLDANGLFSRPGPRLVDGAEVLADIFWAWNKQAA